MSPHLRRLHCILGPVLGIGAFILYYITLSRGPFPGGSAAVMARELGLNPLSPPSNFGFSLLVDLVQRLPFGTLSLRLNMLSAVCGGLGIWLFYRVIAGTIFWVIDVDNSNRGAAGAAAILAGLAGSAFLMLSMPYWYASTRFLAATFDVVLLLGLALLFLNFARAPLVWKGVLFAFLYGACAVEFATLITFGPLILTGIVVALWRHERWHVSTLLWMGVGLLAGLLLYLPAAWQFEHAPLFALLDARGYGRALNLVLRSQYALIAKGLPHVGWLLVMLTGIVPWLVVLVIGRRALNEERDKAFYILNAILTGVAIAVAFNVRFAPWTLLSTYRLLVTPYVLLAACCGYLTAYWFLLPRMWRRDPDEEGRTAWLQQSLGAILAVVLLAVPVTAGVLNFARVDARSVEPVNRYARAVVEAAGTRQWVVTEGVIDDNIRIAALEMGRRLDCLNLQLAYSVMYQKYVGRQFMDVRLQSLAQVDFSAFLREWMAADPDFPAKVAFMVLPDLLWSGGYQPVPDRLLFTGVRQIEGVDADALWQTHQRFWQEPFWNELAAIPQGSMLSFYAHYLLRQGGLVANNCGVLLEDLGHPPQAFESYAAARRLDESNISALLNEVTLVEQGIAAPEKNQVAQALQKLRDNLGSTRLPLWSLSRYYGVVRRPQAYADMGMAWALSGEPGLAIAGYKRAIQLDPEAKNKFTYGLASAYMAQGKPAESDALYRQMLAQNPTNQTALIGLARGAAVQGRLAAATNLLDRAEKAGVSRNQIAIEYAALELAAGDLAKARITLRELVDLQPDLTVAWAMLAGVLLQQNDLKGLDECERALSKAQNKDQVVLFVLGQIALTRSDFMEARNRLDQALSLQPGNVLILENLLHLDVREVREDLAAQHVRALLLADPENAWGNHVLGSLQLQRGELALAEESLRRSLARSRTAEVLNDLAWVLQQRNKLDEAEADARASLALRKDDPAVLDTLGVILLKKGQPAEAEDCLKQALAILPDQVAFRVHLAEIYAKKGALADAVKLATPLLEKASELNRGDREALKEIQRQATAAKL